MCLRNPLRNKMLSTWVSGSPDAYLIKWLFLFLNNVLPMTRSWATAKSRSLTPSSFRSPYPKPPWTSSNPSAALPTWLFQSPSGMRTSLRDILATTAFSWSYKRSFSASGLPCWRAYTFCALGIAGPKDFVYRVLSLQPPHLRTGLGWTKHTHPLGFFGESHSRVSYWWQSPQAQHYDLSFQHSYYLLGIRVLLASGSSSFFGADIIRLDGRIVPGHAFRHNPDRDQLR